MVRNPTALTALLLLFLLPVAAEAQVEGVVRDPAGAPVSGARVVAERAGSSPCETRSAADGAFTLACASSGATVLVEADGFAPLRLTANGSGLQAVLLPAPYRDAVVVTASRTDAIATSGAAPVSVLTAGTLALMPPQPLDDVLRVVPGFSLFRRTTSRAANPTTQGAGLRGLSSSGASRALVLADGVTLNDPFGGWVYWSRVPEAAIERVELVRGGGSDLYGADALAGVVQVLTRRSDRASARVDLDAATHNSGRASVFAGGSKGSWNGSAAGEAFSTDGYILVPEDQRGAIDVPATQKYDSGMLRAGYQASPAFYFRATGDVYAEHRGNGTPLQTNSTDIRQLALEIGGVTAGGTWRVSGQTSDQSYDQTFSSIAGDRQSETLTSSQYVPAVDRGLSMEWQRAWSSTDLVAGADTREVEATSNEQTFAPNGTPRAPTHTPGYQRTSGAYVQMTLRPAAGFTATIGARGDTRQPARDQGILDGDSAFSPRVSFGWTVSPLFVIRGSLGWAFRAPTLNERYRGFRAGNVVTLPNQGLVPESLRSVEGAVLFTPRRGTLRVTFYRNDLSDPVTNVTITSTPQLITRQRENVGAIVAWGSELEGDWRLTSRLSVVGSAAFTSSHFNDYVPLDGLVVPQVPTWQTAIGLRGTAFWQLVFSAQLRAFGRQFDDDRNTLVLNPGSVVDLTAVRPVTRRLDAYVSIENLFDVGYDVGRSPVRTVGQPFTLHGGVRLTFGH